MIPEWCDNVKYNVLLDHDLKIWQCLQIWGNLHVIMSDKGQELCIKSCKGLELVNFSFENRTKTVAVWATKLMKLCFHSWKDNSQEKKPTKRFKSCVYYFCYACIFLTFIIRQILQFESIFVNPCWTVVMHVHIWCCSLDTRIKEKEN